MKDRTDLARGWLLKGDSDVEAARRILVGSEQLDTACFHAQQAAEKYLKGFLAYHQRPFPRTHDVEELARLCLVVEPCLALSPTLLATLTDYGVVLRYDPEFWPDHETAEEALTLASDLRREIAAHLPSGAVP